MADISYSTYDEGTGVTTNWYWNPATSDYQTTDPGANPYATAYGQAPTPALATAAASASPIAATAPTSAAAAAVAPPVATEEERRKAQGGMFGAAGAPLAAQTAPAAPTTPLGFGDWYNTQNYDPTEFNAAAQGAYNTYLNEFATNQVQAQGDPLLTRRSQSGIAELYGLTPTYTGTTRDYSGLGEGGLGAATSTLADQTWYNPIRFSPEMMQYFDANLPAGWDEGLEGSLAGAGTMYGVNTGARGANWQNQAGRLADYMSQFNDPGAQAFATQLRDPATLEGLAQASEQRAAAHKAGSWKTGLGVASVMAPMVMGPILSGISAGAAPAAASAGSAAAEAAAASAAAAGSGIAGGTAFGAVGGGGLGLAGAAGGAAAGQAQGYLSRTLGMDPGFVSTLTDKAAEAAAKAAVQAAATGGDPLEAAMNAAMRAGIDVGVGAGVGALGGGFGDVFGGAGPDFSDLGDIDIPQEGMFGVQGAPLAGQLPEFDVGGALMAPGFVGAPSEQAALDALAAGGYTGMEGAGAIEQPAPAAAPAQQPERSFALQGASPLVSRAVGIIDSMLGGSEESLDRAEGETEEQYNERFNDFAIDTLGLDARAMADRGLVPGSQEYYQYISAETDRVIAELTGGDPSILQNAETADDLKMALRGKRDDQLLQLRRALMVRGQLDSLGGAGEYVDPFSGESQEVVGPGMFNTALAATQRGMAGEAQQLAGMRGAEARGFLDKMLNRKSDLYGLQANANARDLRARLAEQEEELRRRRGYQGPMGDESAYTQDLLRGFSDQELSGLLGQYGSEDEQAAALAQLLGV